MNTFLTSLFVGLALLLGASYASAVSFSGFSLSNSNGGDGYVTGSYPIFTVSGADNGVGKNDTLYTSTVTTGGVLTFNWDYITNDCCGSYWDPAGYILDGEKTQLSVDMTGSPGTGDALGTSSVSLNGGDTFGWYVNSRDSIEGRGNLTVGFASAVPEPKTYAMLLVGLGLIGFMMRRRKNVSM